MKRNLAFYIFAMLGCGYLPAQQTPVMFVTESFLLGRVERRGELEYPLIDRPRIPGKVVFSVLIDTKGQVERADRLAGHAILNDSARKYLQTWKFVPAREGKSTVKMSGTITIWFDLVRRNPIRGLDLPVIRVLGTNSYMVGDSLLNRSDFERWLEQQNIRATRRIVRILVRESPAAEILKVLTSAGAKDISIQYE